MSKEELNNVKLDQPPSGWTTPPITVMRENMELLITDTKGFVITIYILMHNTISVSDPPIWINTVMVMCDYYLTHTGERRTMRSGMMIQISKGLSAMEAEPLIK